MLSALLKVIGICSYQRGTKCRPTFSKIKFILEYDYFSVFFWNQILAYMPLILLGFSERTWPCWPGQGVVAWYVLHEQKGPSHMSRGQTFQLLITELQQRKLLGPLLHCVMGQFLPRGRAALLYFIYSL